MDLKGSVRLLVYIMLMLTVLPSIASAQSDGGTTFEQPIAFIDTAGNLMMTALTAQDAALIAENTGPTEIYPIVQFSNFAFSPDGSTLIYRDFQSQSLMALRSGEEAANVLVEGDVSHFPIAFDATGQTIYYVSYETTPTDSEFYVDHTIYSASINGGESSPVATFTYEVGCGGGTNDPANLLYTVANDAGFLGNGQYFARYAGGFLYTLGCDGIGIGIVTDNGDIGTLDDNLRRAKLSPDGTKLAGIRDNQLIVYDLTLASIFAEYETSIDQLNWLNDTTLVFSSLQDCATISVSAEQAEALELAAVPFESQFCQITLNTLDLSAIDMTPTEIFSGSGYGIGGIAPAGDSALVFTLIDSQYLMTDAENSTAIYYLEIGGDGAQVVAQGVKALVGNADFVIP